MACFSSWSKTAEARLAGFDVFEGLCTALLRVDMHMLFFQEDEQI